MTERGEKAAARADSSVLREAMRLYIMEQRRLLQEQGSPPQGRLLTMLLRRGAMTQAEFGRIMGLEKSWASRSVDRLVAQGWVTRSTLEADRRNVQLQLTPAGKQAAREVDGRLSAHANDVLARLPAAARTRVVNALQELCTALQQPPVSPETKTTHDHE